jgi:hypothetical protein
MNTKVYAWALTWSNRTHTWAPSTAACAAAAAMASNWDLFSCHMLSKRALVAAAAASARAAASSAAAARVENSLWEAASSGRWAAPRHIGHGWAPSQPPKRAQ